MDCGSKELKEKGLVWLEHKDKEGCGRRCEQLRVWPIEESGISAEGRDI